MDSVKLKRHLWRTSSKQRTGGSGGTTGHVVPKTFQSLAEPILLLRRLSWCEDDRSASVIDVASSRCTPASATSIMTASATGGGGGSEDSGVFRGARSGSMRRDRFYGSMKVVGGANTGAEIDPTVPTAGFVAAASMSQDVSLSDSALRDAVARPPPQTPAVLFRLEPSENVDPLEGPRYNPLSREVIVENPQDETRWYWKYFLGCDHQNFAGIEPQSKAPFFLSVLSEEESENGTARRCRAILWKSTGPMRLMVSSNQTRNLSAKGILQKFPGMASYNRNLKEIVNAKLQKDLIILEDQEGCVYCKFGVIASKAGQKSDIEMLGNETGSLEFENFLKILGQRIELSGWGGYRGGLDVSTNMTGKESVYTAFSGHEIMFHVSTLLPFSRQHNGQQIERKRHIGNDIVNIVFQMDGDPRQPCFTPGMTKSQFTHIFAVVTYEGFTNLYRLWVYSEQSVPSYGPALSNPCVFSDTQTLRKFLLTKLINAEKAAFQAKAFVEKRQRTNDTLLKDMYLDYLKNSQKNPGMSIHKVTESFRRHLGGPLKRETSDDKQTFDFTRLGELVKLEKMLSGDVSASGSNSGTQNGTQAHPWQPHILATDLVSWDVISSDSWVPSSLLVAANDVGVIYICDGLSARLIDESARVQQLSVLEHFGIVILRCEKGKDGYLSVFSIADMRQFVRTGSIVHKVSCIERKITATKGCVLYATSEPSALRLNVVASLGKRLTLFRWAFGATGRILGHTNMTERFSELKHVILADEPLMMRTFETHCSSIGAVFSSKAGVFHVDFSSEVITQIKLPSLVTKNLVKIDVKSDNDGEEVLLAFDNVSYVIDIMKSQSDPVQQDIYWSSNISDFVYRFPFVIGFTQDTIEVRLAVNGNILASMYAPGVKLLACKDDIIYATERGGGTSSSLSGDSPESCRINTTPPAAGATRSPRSPRVSSRQKLLMGGGSRQPVYTKRWDLHVIPGRRLSAFDTLTPQHHHSHPAGHCTPNIGGVRRPFAGGSAYRQMNTTTNEPGVEVAIPTLRARSSLARTQLGSDSGFSCGSRTNGDSFDSPGATTASDPFVLDSEDIFL